VTDVPTAPEAEPDGVDDEALRPAFGTPGAVVMRWLVPRNLDGIRADALLIFKVKRLGVARAHRVIEGGDFRTVDGALRPDSVLPHSTEVELWRMPPDSLDDPFPTPTLLHDVDDLVIVDKPADLVVHPSARYLHRTLTSWLKRQGIHANPCHRLDRETSGVMVCARPGPRESAVKTAFARGDVEKTYIAIVRGLLRQPLVIERPLALAGDRGLVRIRMIEDAAGQAARTDVVPLVVDDVVGRTLVQCTPRTGRQHQIRAHLALEGHPLVGDKLYGMGDAWFDAFTTRSLDDVTRALLDHSRQALHALAVVVPVDGERRRFTAPLPADLVSLLSPSSIVDALTHPE
jgi:23S rRNA pseudouridine1911/1915/1917 synthase